MTISRVADLARAIRSVYSALATAGETVPAIQYGARYIGQPTGANRILLVPLYGGADVGGPDRVSAGYVASLAQGLDAHIWSPEPEVGAEPVDEMNMELARDDALDLMIDRYINVVKVLASGRIEGTSITVNPAEVIMAHGQRAVVRYEYARGVEQDKTVYRLAYTAQANRNPDQPNGSTGKTFGITVDMQNERP